MKTSKKYHIFCLVLFFLPLCSCMKAPNVYGPDIYVEDTGD